MARANWRITAFVEAELKREEEKRKQKEKWRKETQMVAGDRRAADARQEVGSAL